MNKCSIIIVDTDDKTITFYRWASSKIYYNVTPASYDRFNALSGRLPRASVIHRRDGTCSIGYVMPDRTKP